MIFCHCAGVTEAEVVRSVLEGAATVEDVSRRCGAGVTCAPCREEIFDLIVHLRPRPTGIEADREDRVT